VLYQIERFYPHILAVMRNDFPPQSAPTPPPITALDFDELNLTLRASWASSTDADTLDKLIKYEFNYASSADGPAELSEDSWQEVGENTFLINLEFPKSYAIGVRGKDDFDNYSEPTVVNWDFPDGFNPLVLSEAVISATQNFALDFGGNVAAVTVFTKDFVTNSKNPDATVCSVKLLEVTATTTIELATNDTTNAGDGSSGPYAYRGYGCNGELKFTFADPPQIEAGKLYAWRFSFNLVGLDMASIKFWGRLEDAACGEACEAAGITPFSDPSIVNAKFAAEGESGTLFSN